MSHVVVLGAGFVGTAVAATLRATDDVSILDQGIDPTFRERSAETRRAIADEIERTGAVAVVNTIGLLRGSDDEMTEANVAWPTWLANDVLVDSGARFVHFGSASEYGDPGSAEPIPETAPANPSGIYGETKWAGSAAVLEAMAGGLDGIVVRAFNLVGPKLPPASPLTQFLDDVDATPDGGTVELWWPDTVRDFILLDDVGAAVAQLIVGERGADIVNLCSSVGVRFGDIVEAMAAAQGKSVTVTSLERPGVPAVVGDASLLRRLTGIDPQMSAELVAARSSR